MFRGWIQNFVHIASWQPAGRTGMLALHPGNLPDAWWNHPSLYKLFFSFDIIQMIGNLPSRMVEQAFFIFEIILMIVHAGKLLVAHTFYSGVEGISTHGGTGFLFGLPAICGMKMWNGLFFRMSALLPNKFGTGLCFLQSFR